MNLEKTIFILGIYLIFLLTGIALLKMHSNNNKEALKIYNNPPAVNNLTFNSILSWKYSLDSIRNLKVISYPDTSEKLHLSDLTNETSLIFRFSGNMCSPCVDFVINRLQFCIQDLRNNDNVIFLYSDANPALAENYFIKKSYFLSEPLHDELDNLSLPYLCLVDSSHQIESLFIPDPSYPELLDKYLEIARSKINNHKLNN